MVIACICAACNLWCLIWMCPKSLSGHCLTPAGNHICGISVFPSATDIGKLILMWVIGEAHALKSPWQREKAMLQALGTLQFTLIL